MILQNLFGSKHKVSSENGWQTFIRNSAGAPVFITSDTNALAELNNKQLTHICFIEIPIIEPNEVGGPIEKEAEDLNKFEEQLIHTLEKQKFSCWFAGRFTTKGQRTLVLYTKDELTEDFRQVVLQLNQKPGYKLNLKTNSDPNYSFYKNNMIPTEEENDFTNTQMLINKLKAAGTDPTKPHAIEFALRGDTSQLAQIAAELQSQNFQVMTTPTQTDWLIVTKTLLLDTSELVKAVTSIRQLSGKYNTVEFDGWSSQVEKHEGHPKTHP